MFTSFIKDDRSRRRLFLRDKPDDRVGHLNTILARRAGNLNDPVFKRFNIRALPGGGGMLKFRFDRRIVHNNQTSFTFDSQAIISEKFKILIISLHHRNYFVRANAGWKESSSGDEGKCWATKRTWAIEEQVCAVGGTYWISVKRNGKQI